MNTVSGVSKDEPREVNEKGASQSRVLYRFDLLDPPAMFEMTKVLKEGADKYGVGNWRGIDVQDHLNHLLIHVYAYLAGDNSDDHLSHIMCRAMFAQAVDIDEKREVKKEEQIDTNDTDPRLFISSVNIIEAIEKKYGKIPADDLAGKVAWVKVNMSLTKLGGADTDDRAYRYDEICISCGQYCIEGRQVCEKCESNNKTGGFKGGD